MIVLLALGPPLLAFFLLFLVPESPTHLIRKNNVEKAEKNCIKLYGPKYDVKTHVFELKFEDKSEAKLFEIFNRPEVRKPFLIVVGLGIVQQFSGMTILRSYVVEIFDNIFQSNHITEKENFNKCGSKIGNVKLLG